MVTKQTQSNSYGRNKNSVFSPEVIISKEKCTYLGIVMLTEDRLGKRNMFSRFEESEHEAMVK